MRKRLYDILIGVIVGIGTILPGFSGGVMAVSFNVYDRIIHSLTNFFSKPIEVIKEIWSLALGVVLGILVAIIGISALLNRYPIQTILFFTGLIVGSIPDIYDKTKSSDNSNLLKKIVVFIIGFLLIVGITFLPASTSVGNLEVDIAQLLILLLVGIVASATMIIPGVSGSLILLAIGYYEYILNFIMDFLRTIIDFNLDGILSNLALIIAFGLGIFIGLFSLAKLIENIINKYPKLFYSAILGLLVASPFAIIYHMYTEYSEVIAGSIVSAWIFGIIFLIIGVISSIYISKSEENLENTKEDK